MNVMGMECMCVRDLYSFAAGKIKEVTENLSDQDELDANEIESKVMSEAAWVPSQF